MLALSCDILVIDRLGPQRDRVAATLSHGRQRGQGQSGRITHISRVCCERCAIIGFPHSSPIAGHSHCPAPQNDARGGRLLAIVGSGHFGHGPAPRKVRTTERASQILNRNPSGAARVRIEPASSLPCPTLSWKSAPGASSSPPRAPCAGNLLPKSGSPSSFSS